MIYTKKDLKNSFFYRRFPSGLIRRPVLKIIRFYQLFISPNIGPHCRFYPSCSQYYYLAVKKYGIIKGLGKGFRRIIKCHPWHPGGIDLP